MPKTSWIGEVTVELENSQRDCVERHTGKTPEEAGRLLLCQVSSVCPREGCGLDVEYQEDSFSSDGTVDPVNDLPVDTRRVTFNTSCSEASTDSGCVGRIVQAKDLIRDFLTDAEGLDEKLTAVVEVATQGARVRASHVMEEARKKRDEILAEARERGNSNRDAREQRFNDAWFSVSAE